MIYSMYRGLTSIAGPMITHYLKKRLKRGKEHPTRFPERMGEASIMRPEGTLIWLHGASVGESVSLLPVIDAILDRYTDVSILMTTGTVTSAALMEKRLPSGVMHQFVPVDRLPFVRKFLDHWKPDFAIWAESELWPNLVCETAKRGTQMALINARMSDKSLRTWQKLKGFASTLLGSFHICLAQTETDGQRYQLLGATQVQCPGNLKYASPDLPVNEEELNTVLQMVQDRPVWLAASTHDGEEVLLGRVHQKLKAAHPDLITMIAPRHPERGEKIVADLRANGLQVAQRSFDENIEAETDLYIADTLGELGLFYRLSPIVFMGKSLQPLGGQNPLEPARLNCAMMCGPYMTNFVEMMARFEQAKAITIVTDEDDMVTSVSSLILDQAKQTDLAQKAKSVAYDQAAVLERTMDALAPYFDKARG